MRFLLAVSPMRTTLMQSGARMIEPRQPLPGKLPFLAAMALPAGSTLIFFIGMLLPASAIGWLRTRLPLLTQFWDGLNASFPMLNPLHVLWYAWIVLAWWILATRTWRWRGIFFLICLSVLGEILQQLVPGRNARMADVFNDLLGVAIGIAMGALLLRVMHGKPARGIRAGEHSTRSREGAS